MKALKKLLVFTIIICITTLFTNALSITGPVTAQAATIKITNKKLELEVGQTQTLKVTGTKSKVKWTSDNKVVATVSGKGKVEALSAGKAKITATVGKTKLTCTVTVIAPANPYLADAPFEAQELLYYDLSFIAPSAWTASVTEDGDTSLINITADNKELQSAMSMYIAKLSDDTYKDYDVYKRYCLETLTKDYFLALFSAELGDKLSITAFEQTDCITPNGKALKTVVEYTYEDFTFYLYCYDFVIGDYAYEVAATDYEKLGMSDVIDYLVQSIMFK
jgi:hypothetical protein